MNNNQPLPSGIEDVIKDLRKRISNLENKTLGSFMLNGTITAYDSATGVKTVIGDLSGEGENRVGIKEWVNDTIAPPVVTSPIVFTSPGIFSITWDGDTQTGEPQAPDYDHLNVYGYSDGVMTLVGKLRLRDEVAIVANAKPGSAWEFYFTSVDKVGNESTLSDPSPIVYAEATIQFKEASAPTNLKHTVETKYNEAGEEYTLVHLTWDAVHSAVDGTDAEVDVYDIWISEDSGNTWIPATNSTTNSATIVRSPGSVTLVKVRAAANGALIAGPFSQEITVTALRDTTPPPVPTAPTVTVGTDEFQVTWNGLLNGDIPKDFEAVDVMASQNSGTATRVGVIRYQSDIVLVPVSKTNTATWQFWLVSRDKGGNVSNPSTKSALLKSVDTRAYNKTPVAPTSVAGTSSVSFTPNGTAVSTNVLTWSAVTKDTDGTTISIKYYNVYAKVNNTYITLGQTTSTSFPHKTDPKSSTIYAVSAVASNSMESARSTDVTVVAASDTINDVVPTKPIVESKPGMFTIRWDGSNTSPTPTTFPVDFRYINVYAVSGTTTHTVGTLSLDRRELQFSAGDPGSQWRFYFRSVDSSDNLSTQSESSETFTKKSMLEDSGIAEKINDLSADITGIDESTNQKLSDASQKTASDLQTLNESLTNAFTTADTTLKESIESRLGDVENVVTSKTTIYFDATPPESPVLGDAWVDSSDSNKIKRWNGTSWENISDTRIASAITQIADTKQLADTKIRTFAQTTAPTGLTSVDTGDLWADTDDSNKLYRWSGTSWVPLDDKRIASLSSEVQTLKNTVATQTTTYLTNIAPTSPRSGDLWFDSGNGNQLKRWNGTSWVSIDDADLTKAISDITQVQGQVDSKVRTFAQVSAPTGLLAKDVGDLWVDTDDSNKLYRWDGTTWVNVQDKNIDAIRTLASGKSTTYFQTTAPTVKSLGDLWIDTDDSNKLYRWDGSTWAPVSDSRIQSALTLAGDAKSIADGKIRTFAQTIAPTGLVASDVGDLWVDTDNDNILHRWDGSSWVPVRDGVYDDLVALRLSGTNLVMNGSGQLNSTEYWNGFVLDPANTPSGYPNIFKVVGKKTIIYSESIAVNPSKTYTMSARITGTAGISHYLLVEERDIDGNTIRYADCNTVEGTENKLASPLNPGDTQFTLAQTNAKWSNVTAPYPYLAVWPYYTNSGKVFNIEDGYTRNNYSIKGATLEGNIVKLPSPWTGPTIDVDKDIAITFSGGTYTYFDSGPLNDSVRMYSGTTEPGIKGRYNTDTSLRFRPGTAFVRPGFLANYNGDASTVSWITGIEFYDSTAETIGKKAQETADLAVSSANGKNKLYRSTSVASGTATNVGDIWYRFTDNTYTKVAQQWTWDGSKWVEAKLEHSTISSLDVGSLTVVGQSTLASVVANRIFADIFAANKITAKELNIASGSLFPDPSFTATSGYGSWAAVNGGIERMGTGAQIGTYYQHLDIAVSPGDSYTTLAVRTTVEGTPTTGSATIYGQMYDSTNTYKGIVALVRLLNDGESSGNWVVPAGISKVRIGFYLENTTPSTNKVRISNVRFLKRTSSVLIEDGAITADKIAANSITANKLVIGSFDNLVQNPGFETLNPSSTTNASSILGWTIHSNQSSGSRDSTVSRVAGGSSLKSTITGDVQIAFSDIIPVDDSGTYRLSMWYLAESGTTNGSVELRLLNKNNEIISSSVKNVTASTTAGTWTRVTKDFTIPSGTDQVKFSIVTRGITSGKSVWFDDVSMVRASDGSLIVDGAIDGKTITGALIQTESTANRGIKLSPTGIDAYNTSGSKVFSVDRLGNALFTGSVNVTGGSVPVNNLTTGTIAPNQSINTATGTAKVELSSSGLKAYDSSGANTVSINSDGSASFTGVIKATSGSVVDGSIITANTISKDKVIGLTNIETLANDANTRSLATETLTSNWTYTGSTTINGGKIQADTIQAVHIATNAITAKHVITGAVFQTSPSASTGIKIDSSKFVSYNSAGTETFKIDANNGDVRVTGGLWTAGTITGPLLQTSAVASTGIKLDSSSLRAYANDVNKTETFKLNAQTGQITMVGGILSGGTITGSTFQTTSTANMGLKITSSGLTAYNTSGSPTVTINSDGSATFTGTINATSSSSIDGASIKDGSLPEIKIPLLNSWKMLNTTSIDGGRIYTGSVTADQIAARSIKASHMDFVSTDPASGGSMVMDSSGIRLQREGATIFQLTNNSVDTISLIGSDGSNVAGMSNDGSVTGLLGSFDEIYVGGDSLNTLLSEQPRGLVARAVRTSISGIYPSTSSDHIQPVMRLEFDVRAGFTYVMRAENLAAYMNNYTGTVGRFLLYTAVNTYAEYGASGTSLRNVAYTPIRPSGSIYTAPTQVSWSFVPTGSYTVSVLIAYSAWGGTEPVYLHCTGTKPIYLNVFEESGEPFTGKVDFLGTASPGSTSSENTAATKRETQTWTATATPSWRNGSAYESSSYPGKHMWQGVYSGDPGAYKKSHAVFTAAGDKGKTIASAASKMTSLEKLEVYLYNSFFYYYDGGKARLKFHNSTSTSSYPSSTTIGDISFKRGEGKWITITNTTARDAFLNGTFKGISLDADSLTSHTYYGYFKGSDGGSLAPKIRATYLTT